MRRAAAQTFRTAYQCTVRGLRLNSRPGPSSLFLPTTKSTASTRRFLSTSLAARSLRPRTADNAPASGPARSSMYLRRASVALVSALVGYGAWYTYDGNATESIIKRAYSGGTVTTGGDGASPTRSVLVIGADELHTGTFVGEGPISKSTGDDGRRVIEMLTPDQATQKLRKTEQSYFVNRGQGVVRYDLVQLPSNDPIEDDHAEKIVEIPNRNEGAESSDWMFWGVFDGHS